MDRIYNPVAGEEIIFHQSARDNQGAKSVMEVTLKPNGGNPLHYHKRFSESFEVLDGELDVTVNKKVHHLKKGDTATAFILDRHRFYNPGENMVRFMCTLEPGSEHFENVLRIGFGLANDGKAAKNGLPKTFMHMAILMNMGEGYFVGVFSLFEKLFRALARTSRARRIQKELIEKYCS